MHRISLLPKSASRRVSSLTSHAQAARAVPSKDQSPLVTPGRAKATMRADLFYDEIMNDMFAPLASSAIPATIPSNGKISQMDDAYLYGPDDKAAYKRQLVLEEDTVNTAVSRYKKMSVGATARGDVVTHRPASDLLSGWFNPMMILVQQAQTLKHVDDFSERKVKRWNSRGKPVRNVNGRIPIHEEISHLVGQLPAEAVSIITIHVVLGTLMREQSGHGVPLSRLAFAIANNLRAEVNLKRIGELRDQQETVERKPQSVDAKADPDNEAKPTEAKSLRKKRKTRAKRVLIQAMATSPSLISAVNYAAKQVSIRGSSWSDRESLILGTTLIDLLMKVAKVEVSPGKFEPAFSHFLKFKKSDMVRVGMLQLSDAAVSVLGEEKDLIDCISPKQQPMVVRPRPWVSPNHGGYLRCHSALVRAPPSKKLDDALAAADLDTLYEGLNALGDTAWTVNRSVLNAAEMLWDNGGGAAGLVTQTNHEVPEKASFVAAARAAFDQQREERILCGEINSDSEQDDDSFNEAKVARQLRSARRKAQKMNRELVSIRADTRQRIEQARSFEGEEKFWLPHNVDFRGRAYPIPVHLQHMGCDLTRAMLTFAKPGLELGPRGVYWLKVHLANKLGGDKLSFDERVAMAEDALPMALQVADDPFRDSNMEWWSTKDDPFQLLAACTEFAMAMGRKGGERALEGYRSCLPVSMDGSCNGLQHYAALGRDVDGGTQVNLVPNSRPQDVYTGVASLVNKRIDELAAEGDAIAQLLQGKISRKVVKQTVMTSVYGVTLIGARQQISNRLAEIEGFPEDKLFAASMKLASLTMSSLGDIFGGATRTMDWLYDSASNISKYGLEVQWITPVGLPVIQPYRRKPRVVVKTLMQRVTLEKHGEHSPVSTARQRSAFAPNFVHSIDSAHMLLTAIESQKRGLRFAAVHDSFWTNAALVDVMNEVLREEFVKLHSRDLLSELRESFLMRYPGVEFREVPPRGELDLSVVRDSPYFFS